MNKIEVGVLHESGESPAGMMTFLARLTQRGHTIKSFEDIVSLYDKSIESHGIAKQIARLPHGTIKRFTPITIAIVGASRRFLAQARTHQVGMNYVSASLQYSDYSSDDSFVVPYELLDDPYEYLDACDSSMQVYRRIIEQGAGNDTAGYVAPQGLRNILIMQGNHESWANFIRMRSCNRNTTETQYVTLRIWEELLKTADGDEMFEMLGPDCLYGKCREGKMSCGEPLHPSADNEIATPRMIIDQRWTM